MKLIYSNNDCPLASNRFSFVVCTPNKENQWHKLPIIQSLQSMALWNVNVGVYVEFENKDGLPKNYNKALDIIGDSDFICFVHDDWHMSDVGFFDKVINSEFDLIGVVGGLQYGVPLDYETRPFLWTEACMGKASGFVQHVLPDKRYFPSSYGIAPSPVVWLDGQCLIMGKKAIGSGLRFDEQFDFDFYDGDICFSARKLGLKVGTAPILSTHASMGQGMMGHKEKYIESQKKFVKKWF